VEADTGKALIETDGRHTGIFRGANVFYCTMADILNEISDKKIQPTG